MIVPLRVIGAIGAVAALMGLACAVGGCRGDRDRPAGAPDGETRRPAQPASSRGDAGASHAAWRQALDALPAVTPSWQRAAPGEPGRPVIERVAGPVVLAGEPGAAEHIVVASSIIGFVALDGDTGAVLWRRPGERHPGSPRPWPEDAAGSLALPGLCAHQPADPPARGPARRPDDRPVANPPGFACIERVRRRDGKLAHRMWLDPAAPISRDQSPGSIDRFLAWTPESGSLWSHGGGIRAFGRPLDSPAAVVPVTATYALPEDLRARVCGVAANPRVLAVATCDGLVLYDRVAGRDSRSRGDRASHRQARWHHRSTRSPGVAGPVLLGERVIWSHDHHLEAYEGERRLWRAEGRYAYAPGALASGQPETGRDSRGGSPVLAVRLDGGIRPAVIDAASGELLAAGTPAPGVQVLHAALRADRMVLVVRQDSSLLYDAIIAYAPTQVEGGQQAGDRTGAPGPLDIVWAWPLPVPAQPRVAAIRVALTRDGVVVFHGGRYVAHLPFP